MAGLSRLLRQHLRRARDNDRRLDHRRRSYCRRHFLLRLTGKLIGPVGHVPILRRLVLVENGISGRAVRPARRCQQAARLRVLEVDELQHGVEIPLRDSPAGILISGSAKQPQAGLRLRPVTTRRSAVVHQHGLDQLRERLHRAGRQAANHPIQFVVGWSHGRIARSIGRRLGLHGHLQPALQGGDHGIVRLCGRGVGQLRGGRPPQIMPQAPLGQFQVVVNIVHLDQGPLPLVAFFQASANHVDVGSFQTNLAVRKIDDPASVGLRDASLDDLPIAENDDPLPRLPGLVKRRRVFRAGGRYGRGQDSQAENQASRNRVAHHGREDKDLPCPGQWQSRVGEAPTAGPVSIFVPQAPSRGRGGQSHFRRHENWDSPLPVNGSRASAKHQPPGLFRFSCQRPLPEVEGDSPIFTDTKIGTVP